MADVTLELGLDNAPLDKKLDETVKKSSKSGKDAGEGFEKRFTPPTNRAFKRLAVAAATAAAAVVAALGTRASIRAAIVQQDAVNALNSALFQTGQFSQETSQELQDFASELQKVTRFGDEAVIAQLAYSQSLGATIEQSKELVTASVDLATALGTDLASANAKLTQTLSEQAGSLARVIPELRDLTEEQLKAGAGIELVAQKFAGFAARDAVSFSGALEQLKNNFGDLGEEIGFLIVNNPAFIAAFQIASDVVTRIGEAIKAQSGAFIAFTNEAIRSFLLLAINVENAIRGISTAFQPAIENTIVFGQALNQLLGPVTIGAINTIKVLFNGLATGLLEVARAAVFSAKGLALLADLIPGVNISTKGFDATIQNLTESIQGFREATSESIGDLLDPASYETGQSLSEVILSEFALIKEGLQEGADSEEGGFFAGIFEQFSEENLNAISERLKNFGEQAKTSIESTAEGIEKSTVDISRALHNAFVNATSSAFQEFGKQLVQGELNFKSFVGLALSALGDLAISIGTTVIASSLAIQAIPLAGGVLLGAALVAIGGAIKAFSGSFGGGGASGAPQGSGFAATPAPFQDDGPLSGEDRRADQNVQLIVQGDVLDSEETGTRLLDIFNSKFERENSNFIGARFA